MQRITNDWVIQRAGQKGISYTYFTTENSKNARELVTILREAKALVPPELEEMASYGGGGGGRGRYGGGGGRGGRGGGRGGGGGGVSHNFLQVILKLMLLLRADMVVAEVVTGVVVVVDGEHPP